MWTERWSGREMAPVDLSARQTGARPPSLGGSFGALSLGLSVRVGEGVSVSMPFGSSPSSLSSEGPQPFPATTSPLCPSRESSRSLSVGDGPGRVLAELSYTVFLS